MTVKTLGPLFGSGSKTVAPALDGNLRQPLLADWFDNSDELFDGHQWAADWTYNRYPLYYQGDYSLIQTNSTPVITPTAFWAPYDWPPVNHPVVAPKVVRLLLVYPYPFVSDGSGRPGWLRDYYESTIPMLGSLISQRYGNKVLYVPQIQNNAIQHYWAFGAVWWLREMGAYDSLFGENEDGSTTGTRNLITSDVLNLVVCMRHASRSSNFNIIRYAYLNYQRYGLDGTSNSFEADIVPLQESFEQFPGYAAVCFTETGLNDPEIVNVLDYQNEVAWAVNSFIGTVNGLADFNFSYGGTIGDFPQNAYNAESDANKLFSAVVDYFG